MELHSFRTNPLTSFCALPLLRVAPLHTLEGRSYSRRCPQCHHVTQVIIGVQHVSIAIALVGRDLNALMAILWTSLVQLLSSPAKILAAHDLRLKSLCCASADGIIIQATLPCTVRPCWPRVLLPVHRSAHQPVRVDTVVLCLRSKLIFKPRNDGLRSQRSPMPV